MEKIDIIIPCANIKTVEHRRSEFIKCVSSINQVYFNICISDTSDNSEEEWFKNIIPECKYIWNKNPTLGYNKSFAVNMAFKKFDLSDFFIICDADMILDENFNITLRETLEGAGQDAGLFRFAIKPEKNSQYIHPKILMMIFGTTKEAFDKIGGFDEEFDGWGYEDTEISNRYDYYNIKQIDCYAYVIHGGHSINMTEKQRDGRREKARHNKVLLESKLKKFSK